MLISHSIKERRGGQKAIQGIFTLDSVTTTRFKALLLADGRIKAQIEGQPATLPKEIVDELVKVLKASCD